MTDPTMALMDYLSKFGPHIEDDVIREGVRVLIQSVIEAEVIQRIGAKRYERTPERVTQRKGYRQRVYTTRVEDVTLQVPMLREGCYFPSFLEPRRKAEKALLAVVQSAYLKGFSTRRVDHLLLSLGLTGIDKRQVSRICKALDEPVKAFRERPLSGEYPYVWLDATYLKVRQNHHIVSMAAVVAIGVRETESASCCALRWGPSSRTSMTSGGRHAMPPGHRYFSPESMRKLTTPEDQVLITHRAAASGLIRQTSGISGASEWMSFLHHLTRRRLTTSRRRRHQCIMQHHIGRLK